jgi:hypothetical protein
LQDINVMDYRATHPKAMPCYGLVPKTLQKNPDAVVEALRSRNIPLFCLGKTATGHPKHPLYLGSDTRLEQF